MKKVIFLGIAIILALVIIGYFMINNKRDNFTYSMDNYRELIENNSLSYQVGEIKNSDMALEAGEKLFIDHFGEEILKEKPFKAYYDESSKTWMILGTLKQKPFFILLGELLIQL